MLRKRDTASKWAAAAIACSLSTQYLASREARPAGLTSEILAWALLPLLFLSGRAFDLVPRSSPKTLGHAPLVLQCVVAGSLAGLELFKAENDVPGLWPAISPLVLIAQRYPHTNLFQLSQQIDVPLPFSHLSSLDHALTSPPARAAFTAALAVVSTLALTRWQLLELGISTVIVAVVLCVVYLSIRNEASPAPSKADTIGDGTATLSLTICLALIIALLIETRVLFGLELSASRLMPILSSALTKASSWFFLAQLSRDVSWSAVFSIGTFTIMASLDPSRQSSEACAILNVIVACIALSQIVSTLPKSDKLRHLLWLFSLFSLLPFFSNTLVIRDAQYAAVRFSQGHTHPVESLMLAARADFEALLQRQSTNLETARREYRRRYEMEPPPGFDAWYEYAVANQSPIIDDFDIIYQSVSPFWRLSGNQVIQAMRYLQSDPNLVSDLWRCRFSEQSGETICENPHRTSDRHYSLLFHKLLGGLHGVLPNVTFLANHLDEPMVMIPPPASGSHASTSRTKITSTDLAHKSTWAAVTRYCGRRSTSSSSSNRTRLPSELLIPFVDDVSAGMDLCQHPEYRTMHGLFMSPTSFVLVEGPAPILSVGAPSTMGDILFPSAAYIESGFRYDEATDIDWDSKTNNLYWAGSTTGGYAADDSWRSFQRQRFATLTQNPERQPRQYYYLRDEGEGEGEGENGGPTAMASPFLNTRLFDVSITRIFQCARRSCSDQRHFFSAQSWADANKALRSRLVFDLDGNGISGRYYKLLASRSAPLKQTLFREWHDDRLVPWVHYIPVSQGMEELPELVSYLTSTERGERAAREVAEQGREWHGRALREVDMGIYMYRLMLELARLQDPSRRARRVAT